MSAKGGGDTSAPADPLAPREPSCLHDDDLPLDSTESIEASISDNFTRHWGQSRCDCRGGCERWEGDREERCTLNHSVRQSS